MHSCKLTPRACVPTMVVCCGMLVCNCGYSIFSIVSMALTRTHSGTIAMVNKLITVCGKWMMGIFCHLDILLYCQSCLMSSSWLHLQRDPTPSLC